MRVYQLRHYEVMMRDEKEEEIQHLLYYEQLCYDLLTDYAISTSRAVEIARVAACKIEQRPGRIHKLLSASEIPAFCFIIGKN